MFRIASLAALEILDSRGRPTVKATCRLADGAGASASVPSGASTGAAEALELRDGDPHRYRGLGCRQAVANVTGPILAALAGREFGSQSELDRALIAVDGTPNKSRLGANAILPVSIAVARAVAAQRGVELHRHFADLAGVSGQHLPRPTVNLFSGGKHAGGQAPIQDVLLVPAAARDVDEALSMAFAVYYAAADLCAKKYSMRLLGADEGGLAPPFACAESMLEDAVIAIENAGLQPGREVALAIDVAATHFHRDGRYALEAGDRRQQAAGSGQGSGNRGQDLTPVRVHSEAGAPRKDLSSTEMIDTLARWVSHYPIVSVEDGLAEEDWAHWPRLVERLQGKALVVGDDFLCTNPVRIRRAIEARAATALLLKVNQIGTLTEAIEARSLATTAGWEITVSARSGETEDDWLADLAVGLDGGQIKIGSITQSERLAKYNRLLAIEAATGLKIATWPNPS